MNWILYYFLYLTVFLVSAGSGYLVVNTDVFTGGLKGRDSIPSNQPKEQNRITADYCDSLKSLIDAGKGILAADIARKMLLSGGTDSLQHRICALHTLGYYFLTSGQYDSSILYLEPACQQDIIYYDPGYTGFVAQYVRYSCHLLGMAYELHGKRSQAREAYNKTLRLILDLDSQDFQSLAILFLNIGSLCQYEEDYHQARQYFQEALRSINKVSSDPVLHSYIHNNLGTVNLALGKYWEALGHLLLSDSLLGLEFPLNHMERGFFHYNAGIAFLNLGNIREAVNHFRDATGIFRGALPGSGHEMACCYGAMAGLYARTFHKDSAIMYYDSCLYLLRKQFGARHPEIAKQLNALADFHYQLQCYDTAFKLFQEAIDANFADTIEQSNCNNPKTVNRVFSRTDLVVSLAGKILSGEKAAYFRDGHACLSETETLLALVLDEVLAGHKSMGSKFLYAEKTREILAGIMNQLYFQQESGAFSTEAGSLFYLMLEKCKANILSQSIFEKSSVLSGAHNRYHYTLRNSLVNEHNRLLSLQHSNILYGDDIGVVKDSIDSRLFYLSLSIDSLDERSDTAGMHLISRIPGLPEVMARLDPGEAILDYIILDSLIVIATITHEGIEITRSPAKDVNDLIRKYLKSIKFVDIQGARSLSRSLYNLLVFPVEQYIRNKHKLIIIPDGPLFNLPFETLVRESGVDPCYLLRDYEIVYNYSVSVWYYSGAKGSWPGLEDNFSFAGFAPVFRDPDVISTDWSGFADTVSLRSFTGPDGRITELPHSEKEVAAVAGLFEAMGLEARTYLFKEASEGSFKRDFAKFQVLHIASHGFANEDYGVSGLVFYHPGNNADTGLSPEASAGEDGILFMDEFHTGVSQNRLVVLSCCESGLGRLVRGEGVISLTRGFLDTGADHVIISLWKISDLHSMKFMQYFYQFLIQDYSPSEALRLAKLEMLNNPGTSSLLLWAPFVLTGH